MGASNVVNKSIISNKFLQSLTIVTPLKSSINHAETQVHQINCLSAEHHQIMLEKIRIKKGYDCPFIIRIIDSHTLESKNLCSTITKTYIVVEKPQSLAEEIEQRTDLSLGFDESQIWTLVYSCTMGGLYLKNNNVGLAPLNASQIFIDLIGRIKINDPDFSESSLGSQRINQSQFIESLSHLCEKLMSCRKINYSQNLLVLIGLMGKGKCKFGEIEIFIKQNYIGQKKQHFHPEQFSSVKKSRQQGRAKQKLKILSGRKKSMSLHPQINSETIDFACKQRFDFPKQSSNNKQNWKNNHAHFHKNRIDLYASKNTIKTQQQLGRNELSENSHKFPRKALFSQRRHFAKPSETSLQMQMSSSSTTHKQILTRESQSVFFQSDPSLDGSQLLNLISSYQVDQETFVRQICQEQSEYFLELMNQMKFKGEINSPLVTKQKII